MPKFKVGDCVANITGLHFNEQYYPVGSKYRVVIGSDMG